MKTFKTIAVVLLTIFLAVGVAWSDPIETEGWIDITSFKDSGDSDWGGNANVNAGGGYNLIGNGVEPEGYAHLSALTVAEHSENVNEEGFLSHNANSFFEFTGLVENRAGEGPLELNIQGAVENQSQIGDSNTFANAQQQTKFNYSEEAQSKKLNLDARVAGFSSAAEKIGENFKVEVGQIYAEYTRGPTAEINVNGLVNTGASKERNGLESHSRSSTKINGLSLDSGEGVSAFNQSTVNVSEEGSAAFSEGIVNSGVFKNPIDTGQSQ